MQKDNHAGKNSYAPTCILSKLCITKILIKLHGNTIYLHFFVLIRHKRVSQDGSQMVDYLNIIICAVCVKFYVDCNEHQLYCTTTGCRYRPNTLRIMSVCHREVWRSKAPRRCGKICTTSCCCGVIENSEAGSRKGYVGNQFDIHSITVRDYDGVNGSPAVSSNQWGRGKSSISEKHLC